MSKLLHTKAEKIKLLKTFPSNTMGNDGDIALSSISGRGTYICAKTNGRWYAANKMQDLNNVEKTSLTELSLKKLKLGEASLTKDQYTKPIGNFTLDVGGDIALSSDGGNVTMDDGTKTIFDFDVDGVNLKIMDDANTSDYFKITVESEGATTLSTVDADTSVGHLVLAPDGILKLRPGQGQDLYVTLQSASVKFYEGGNIAAKLSYESGDTTSLTLYEAGGDGTDGLAMTVEEHGATTISTVDGAAAAAHLTLQPDGNLVLDAAGDITLDAAGAQIEIDNAGTTFGTIDTASAGRFKLVGATNYNLEMSSIGTGDIIISSADNITIDAADNLTIDTDGTYIMMKDGTEYSAANSAYAGMILGYTSLLNDAADTSYAVTASFVTIDSTARITFVAPPSGNVEISTSMYIVSTATRQFSLGLSDNASYNTIDVTHEHKVYDDFGDHIINHQWVVTGLTAGTSYTYFIGAKAAQAGRITLYWGGDATEEFAPFIIKATALPATLYEG